MSKLLRRPGLRTIWVDDRLWDDEAFSSLSDGAALALFKLTAASDYALRSAVTAADLARLFKDNPPDWEAWLAELSAAGLTQDNQVGRSVVSPFFRRVRRFIAGRWQRLRAWILARDNHACRYCGAVGLPLHVDHVIPRSRGGSNDPGNLVAACAPCNLSKSDKPVEQWLAGMVLNA